MSEWPLPLAPHGTRARYLSRRDPCRCEACRAANTEYITLYRKQNRSRVLAQRRRRRAELRDAYQSPDGSP